MSLHSEGFLSKEISTIESEIDREFAEEIQLWKELNKTVEALKCEFRPVPDALFPSPILILFFIKAIHTFQAINVLLRKSMAPDARVLTRSLFENYINLAYCVKSEENFNGFVCGYLMDYLEKIERARNAPSDEMYPKELTDPAHEIEIRILADPIIKTHGHLKRTNLKDRAKAVKRLGSYRTTYANLSSPAHSDMMSLENYASTNHDGKMTFFPGPKSGKPDFSDFHHPLELMYQSGWQMARVYDLKPYRALDEFKDLFSNLVTKRTQNVPGSRRTG